MKHWGSALSFFKRGNRRRRSSYAHTRYELVNRRARSARNDLSAAREVEVDTPLYMYVLLKLHIMLECLKHKFISVGKFLIK